MVKVPSLSPYFLGSVRSGAFLYDLFEEYKNLVVNYKNIGNLMSSHKI